MPYRPGIDNEKHKLRMRRYRIEKAIRCIWHRLRSRSKERGHTCGISYEDFEAWCLETGYHLLRGRFKDDASIDRIDVNVGYEKGNLQVLTVGQNAAKGAIERRGGDWQPMDIEDF